MFCQDQGHTLNLIIPGVLEEFLNYVKTLEFDTAPDYDRCREMFKKAMKKLKIPLDGKLDFSAPKSPAKKVGSSPSKRSGKRSVSKEDQPSPRKPRKTRRVVPESDDEEEEEEEVVPKPTRRRRARVELQSIEESEEDEVPSNKPIKKVKKSIGCQTSPAFVKRAKAAKKAAEEKVKNPEMDQFVSKAIKAAKAATRSSPVVRKSSKKVAKEAENDISVSNPTPAMVALMKKRQESSKKTSKR